jgi:hypothetical protein
LEVGSGKLSLRQAVRFCRDTRRRQLGNRAQDLNLRRWDSSYSVMSCAVDGTSVRLIYSGI